MENNTKKIYQALAKANKEITSISKGNRNQQQGFMYRGIDDVYNDLHKVLADNEIFIVPEVLEYKVDERPSKSGGILFYTRATICHHFMTSDGSEVVTQTVGEAMDSGDKGMNKAMSIALKYAIMQMFTIPTSDPKDPEAETPQVQLDPVERAAWLLESKDVNDFKKRYKEIPQTLRTDRNIMMAIQEFNKKING